MPATVVEGMSLSVSIISQWERCRRFAASMGLDLKVAGERLVIADKTDGKVISTLSHIDKVERVLTLYHRVEVKFPNDRACKDFVGVP